MRRDLLRILKSPELICAEIRVPLKIGNACMRCSMPALNPVDVFCRVLELQPQLICRSQDVLESFWEAVSEHPGVRRHPVKQVPGYRSRAVPLVLHGDGVPIDSQDRSCAFVSWRSLVATRASARLAHQLFCAVWTSRINVGNGASTVACVWNQLVRAFEKPLQTAADNQDLFPILLFLTGDLEWFANSHDLPRWNANEPCGHCRGEKADLFKFKNVASPADDPWLLPRDSTCCAIW